MANVDQLVEQALELNDVQRVAFLQSLPADQRTAVEELLAADASLQERSDGFLQTIDHDSTNVDATLPPSAKPTHLDATIDSVPKSERPAAQVDGSVRYFGEYELLQEIARGGMGVVFKAKQVNLNRVVALKMILSGQLAGEDEVARFKTEAEAAAKLDHWGIVPIYEIGEQEGQHYFSMGFVEGESLQDTITNGPLAPRGAAELCAKITEAIAYAHDRGVIHRDLKPANVLMDGDGQPKITDFGLAKQVQGDSQITRTGAVMGTPSYMPPEQAAGGTSEVGPLADVYSLGAILYCLLTGRPPFQAASVLDTLKQVMEREPVSPRQLNPNVPPDLETITLKCLEKDPERRYASAQDFAEEINRYLNNEPIVARPIGRLERSWRWCKRKPAVAGLIAVAAALLLLLSVGGPWIAIQQAGFARKQVELKTEAVEARDEADERRREADEARGVAETAQKDVERERTRIARMLYATRISLAHREWLDNNPQRAQQLLNECPTELRNWEWHYLDGLTRSEEMAIFAHGIPASVQFFPNGKSVMTRGTQDSTLKFWDVSTGLETETNTVPNLRGGKVLADGEHALVTAGTTVSYVGIEDREIETFGDFKSAALAGLVYDDGKRVAAAFYNGIVALYERETGNLLHRTPTRLKSDSPHVFEPSAKYVAGVQGRTLKVWDVQTGDVHFEVAGHVMSVEGFRFSPDGTTLASVGRGGNLMLTDVASGKRLRTIRAHFQPAKTVAFSHDGKRVATGSEDNTCRVFGVETGDELLVIRGHTQAVHSVDLHPDGSRLATASADGTVRIWNINDRILLAPTLAKALAEGKSSHLGHTAELGARIFYGHPGAVYDVAVSPDGRFVTSTAIGSSMGDEQVQVWSLETMELHAGFPVHGGYLHSVSYSADSKYLVVASGGAGDVVAVGGVAIWDLATKEKYRQLEGVPCMLTQAVLNRDNDLLAVAYGNLNNGRIRFYSFPELELQDEQTVTGERLSAIAFSASGEELLSSTHPGGSIAVWHARTGQQLGSFKAHGIGVFRIAVGSDDRLATANIDSTIGIWDWRKQTRLGELKGHGTYAVDVHFSPDGSRLVSSSEDETVKIWDLTSYSELLSFRDHRQSVMGADWSADGTTIATTSRDGSLIVRQLAGRTSDIEDTTDWVTLYEDDFAAGKFEDNWSASPAGTWKIEGGRLIGTLGAMPHGGSAFPMALAILNSVDLPRTVEMSADATLRQPMLAQFIVSNRRTSQYIAPFVSSSPMPYGFTGSSVQLARGAGSQNKLLGSRSDVKLEPGKTYRFRVIRHREDLKFYLDDRMIEHVRVPTMEADQFQVSGAWSKIGDQIEIDNVLIRVPQSAVRSQEIRTQVNEWLTSALLDDVVEGLIEKHYQDEDERQLANAFLKTLSSGKALTPGDLINAFTTVAMKEDATEEELAVALAQAEYYIKKQPEAWWNFSRVGLVLLRAGKAGQALRACEMAIEKGGQKDGHALPLALAGRALALHELGRQQEAEATHWEFSDIMLTRWSSKELTQIKRELEAKVPLTSDPLREMLVAAIVERSRAYWYGRNIKKAMADTTADFVSVLGRGSQPSEHDREYDLDSTKQLQAIFTASNPPPRLQLVWDNIQFDHEDSRATVEYIEISKFENFVFRFGQRIEFEERDGRWMMVRQRTWPISNRISGKWTVFNEQHWSDIDEKITQMKKGGGPKLAAMMLSAKRVPEAYEVAKAAVKEEPENAAAWSALGEVAVSDARFEEGIAALEHARQLDHDVKLPWFLTRLDRCFTARKDKTYGVDFHPSKDIMVSAHEGKAIVLWDLKTHQVVRSINDAHGRLVADVIFSHDGSKIISAGWDNAINVIDTETGERTKQMSGHLQRLYRLDLHPTRELVVSSSADGTAKIWDVDEGRELLTLTGHSRQVMGAVFSPDGSRVATASEDGTIGLWNVDDGKAITKIQAHEKGTWRVDWMPDGKTLVSAGRDGSVRIWDATTYEQKQELVGHANDLEVVRVSPDGKLIASADVDGVIYIWDAVTGNAITILHGQGAIYNLQFHGTSLFSVGADKMIRKWDVDFSKPFLKKAIGRLGRVQGK